MATCSWVFRLYHNINIFPIVLQCIKPQAMAILSSQTKCLLRSFYAFISHQESENGLHGREIAFQCLHKPIGFTTFNSPTSHSAITPFHSPSCKPHPGLLNFNINLDWNCHGSYPAALWCWGQRQKSSSKLPYLAKFMDKLIWEFLQSVYNGFVWLL